MIILRYLIFLLFNLSYKDGNYKDGDMPHFTIAGTIMVYEAPLLLIFIFFLNKYVDFSSVADVLKPLGKIVYGFGMLMCALMYPINHYYFIKKKGFDRIYNEFKKAAINTKRNRIIGWSFLALFIPVMAVIVGHLKYWFP